MEFEIKDLIKPLKLTSQFMIWKEDSLKAFGLYRWLLKAEDTGSLKLEILSNPELKAFLPSTQGLGLEDMFYDIKDKIFSLIQANEETVFAYLPLQRKTYTVKVSELMDFLTQHENESPSWWPTHFASPGECDTWVAEQLQEMDNSPVD